MEAGSINDADELTEATNEHEIMAAWALRFDGWAYRERTAFDHARALKRYLRDGRVPRDPMRRLATFFMLQRWLGKWGGEYEPMHGRSWRRFRELFLRTHAIEVPAEWQADYWYASWKGDWLPREGECIAVVRQVHGATVYDDEAKPNL